MATPLDVTLYEAVTPWSVRPIVELLRSQPDADVRLFINSLGGDVYEGWTLANVLRGHKGKTVAIIEGICASAATFISCACSETHMYAESLFMVHNPWGGLDGGAEDLEKYAQVLRKMADLTVGIYQRKTGADEKTLRAWMEAETHMTPQEALAAGFCDQVLADAPSPAAKARTRRLVAQLRRLNPRSTRSNMALPDELRAKLAKHGLGENPTREDVMAAFMTYLSTTEDGTEARQEMMRCVNALKDDDFEEESSTGDGPKNKLRQNASTDLGVQKLVEDLTGQVSVMQKKVEGYEAAERTRRETEFFAVAKQHTSDADARDYLKACGGDFEKALALIKKLPKRSSVMGAWYAGGRPVGGSSSQASAETYEKTKTIQHTGPRLHLHGYGLAQLARKLAADKKIPLLDAYKQAARERPDLAQADE